MSQDRLEIKKLGTKVGDTAVKALAAIALNATAATRTVRARVAGLSEILVSVVLTQSAATNVTIAPSLSQDGGTTYARATTQSVAADGTITVAPATYTRAVSGSENFAVSIAVAGADYVELVFAGASAGANDKVDVYVTGVAP